MNDICLYPLCATAITQYVSKSVEVCYITKKYAFILDIK